MPRAARTPDPNPSEQSGAFGRWRFWRRWFGQRSERYAAKYLRKHGYKILAVNIADRRGELDLLVMAPDRTTLVVVEVRSTSQADPHIAASTVDFRKQKRISDATLRFLQKHRLFQIVCRFDIFAIAWPELAREPSVLHIENAFESIGKFQFYS